MGAIFLRETAGDVMIKNNNHDNNVDNIVHKIVDNFVDSIV